MTGNYGVGGGLSRFFWVIFGATSLLTIVSWVGSKDYFAECHIDRFDASIPQARRVTSRVLFVGTQLSIIALYCVTVWIDRRSACRVALIVNFTTVCYCLLSVLRHLGADYACAKNKPNGVSGHFFFYTFHIWVFARLLLCSKSSSTRGPPPPIEESDARKRGLRRAWPSDEEQQRLESGGCTYNCCRHHLHTTRRLEKVRIGLYACFLAVSAAVLFRTWRYGFHSPAQILYGTLFGLVSYAMCVELQSYADVWAADGRLNAAGRRRSRIVDAAAFWGYSASTCFILCCVHCILGTVHWWDLTVWLVSWAKLLYG